MQRSIAVCLVLVIIVVGLVANSRIRKHRRNAKAAALGCLPPPVLRSTNLIGNSILTESMKATKEDRGPQYVVEKMDSISPNCHTLQVPILDYEIFVTRDPENVRVILSGPDFDISSTRQLSFMPLLGKGIFTSRGNIWKHSRALLRPQFAREIIGNVRREEQHVQVLMNRLHVNPATSWTDKLDLGPLFFKLALDTATEFIFGHSTNSLQDGGHGQDISYHFDAAKEWIDQRGALAKFYWLLNSKEFNQHCKAIHSFADSIIADRLANPNQSEKKARFNLLSELAKTVKNPRALRNEMLHVLVAGRDTTGCLLGWVFYFLARHPKVYQKLRCKTLEHFANERPDFGTLGQIDYLKWVINETLRFIAIVPMNERVALRDTTLPRGGGPEGRSKVFIAAGTQVLIPLYAMQHRADIWGPDVEEFRPERWETHRRGWEFIPFGAGFRKCLGQPFARMEVSYVVARFCQRYDRIENMEEGDGRIRLHQAIETRSGTGVQVRLREAKTWTG